MISKLIIFHFISGGNLMFIIITVELQLILYHCNYCIIVIITMFISSD